MTFENPIIILGCQRSGTTLLTTILDQHPMLRAHPNELQIINGLMRLYGPHLPNTEKAIQYVCNQPLCPPIVTPAKLRKILGPAHACSLHDFVQSYLQAWHGNDPRRMVLKYPRFVFRLPLLDQLFPKATYLHLVRDPRANVASQIARWPGMTVWEAARLWHDVVATAQQWQLDLPKRTYALRYESLVMQPDAVLPGVCQQLDIDYTVKMVRFEMETRRFAPGKAPEMMRYSGLISDRLAVWRKRLDPVEVRIIEDMCGSLMQTYGYMPERPQVNKFNLRRRSRQQQIYHWVLTNGRWLKNRGRHLQRLWRRVFE